MKYCLIGTGVAAAMHVKALRKNSGDVIAVCGSNVGRTKNFAKIFKIKKCYSDPDYMFDMEKAESVIIASIPSEHLNHILAAKNVNNIVVEKPLVIKLADIEYLKKIQKNISVVYQNRFCKSWRLLKDELDGAKIYHIDMRLSQFRGEEYYKREWRKDKEKAGGGVLIQNGIHWINFLCSIIGYDFEVKYMRKDKDIEDEIEFVLDNRVFTVNSFISRSSVSEESYIKIYCKGKTIMLTRSRFVIKKDGIVRKAKLYLARFPLGIKGWRNLHIGNLNDFWKNIENNKSNGMFFEDAINDVKLIEKVYKWT